MAASHGLAAALPGGVDETMDRTLAPIRVPLHVWAAALVATFLMYVVFQENGVLLARSWETLHEFFHDGRHLFGVPCH